MLQEIEDLLVETLRKNIKAVSGDQVGTEEKAEGKFSIGIECVGFRFSTQQAVDSEGSRIVEVSEVVELKAGESRKKLKNKPEGGSLEVQVIERKEGGKESWIKMNEGEGYTVDYKTGVIEFRQPVWKSKIRYKTSAEIMRRVIKLVSKYFINVRGDDRQKMDSIAEEVVRILLSESDTFEGKGINIRPLSGSRLEGGLRIICIAERELAVEFEVGVIEKIEIGHSRGG